jgi:hypothetical protein
LICILYALLCGQNFILVKSGCYRGGGQITGEDYFPLLLILSPFILS